MPKSQRKHKHQWRKVGVRDGLQVKRCLTCPAEKTEPVSW